MPRRAFTLLVLVTLAFAVLPARAASRSKTTARSLASSTPSTSKLVSEPDLPSPLPFRKPHRSISEKAPSGPFIPGPGCAAGAVHDLITAAWPSLQWSMALFIANRESHCDPQARNPSGASGVFQLMPIWFEGHNAYGWPTFDPFDAALNVKYAHLLWLKDGWGPWGF